MTGTEKGQGLPAMKKLPEIYQKDFFPEEIENIFFVIFLPRTKPITIGVIYRPPSQINFLQTLNENFTKLHTLKKELYMLGDFNLNFYQNQNHGRWKSNILVSPIVSNDVNNYLQFCTTFGITQLNLRLV